MTKSEFEYLIHGSVTDEEYELIETVYMWHPAIRNTSGKEEVAELYKSFGLIIFKDIHCHGVALGTGGFENMQYHQKARVIICS